MMCIDLTKNGKMSATENKKEILQELDENIQLNIIDETKIDEVTLLVPCILYIVSCTLYPLNCTLYTVSCTLYTVPCMLYTVHRYLYPLYRSL